MSEALRRVEGRCPYGAVSLLSVRHLELYWAQHVLCNVSASVVAFLLTLPK